MWLKKLLSLFGNSIIFGDWFGLVVTWRDWNDEEDE